LRKPVVSSVVVAAVPLVTSMVSALGILNMGITCP
jgi:hypothetical protein